MKKYSVLIETGSKQLFLFTVDAESYKQANALVLRESMQHEFLHDVDLYTVGVFEEGSAVNMLENSIRG